jgi:hypothetical protein
MKLHRQRWAYSILLSFLLLCGCEKKKGDFSTAPNPVDTSSTAFVPPVTTLLDGPSNNEVLHSASAIFKWSGTKDVVRYELSINNSSWLSTTNTSYTYDYLDEGQYAVVIRAIHQNGTIEKNPPIRTFTVDAVTADNSIMFYPRKNLSAALNVVSSYQIRCENFKNVAGVQLTLQYNLQLVDITDVSNLNGSIFNKNGMSGQILLTSSGVDTTIINIVGLPTRKDVPFGVTGSDILLTLSVKPKQKGEIPITIVTTKTLLRDSANTNLNKGSFVNGLIEVQ